MSLVTCRIYEKIRPTYKPALEPDFGFSLRKARENRPKSISKPHFLSNLAPWKISLGAI